MPDLLESQNPRRGNHHVETVTSTPPNLDQPTSITPPTLAALRFEKVSKWYGPVIGVNQVSLELHAGITGLVGSNGAGKSTMLRLAGGYLRPDLGRVLVSGEEAWSAAGKHHIGYCPDSDRFFEDMSGRQFVRTMAMLSGFRQRDAYERTDQMLELVGMTDRCHKPIQGYSKGMRQRIKLAQALVHDPALLLLDEPMSGIDPVGRREMVELFLLLAERGKCLFISSHELDELEKLTDHVVIMARGRIAAVGTLPEIRRLLADQPMSIRLGSDDCRRLASELMQMEEVVGLQLESNQRLTVRARQPEQFYSRITNLVLDEGMEINHLEALDDSTQAILSYLLK